MIIGRKPDGKLIATFYTTSLNRASDGGFDYAGNHRGKGVN